MRQEDFQRGHQFPGVFISFESGEGAGKDTQMELFVDYLRSQGFCVESGREPGKTEPGKLIRDILQNPDVPELNERTELLLYLAAGSEFLDKEVLPVLRDGGVYVSNRYRDSTMAYQGYGNGTNDGLIRTVIPVSTAGVDTDLTFLLDIDAEVGLKNLSGNEFSGHELDKVEARSLEFHKRVNQGYREIARRNPSRVKVIPYLEGDVEGMQNQVRDIASDFIDHYDLRDNLRKVG